MVNKNRGYGQNSSLNIEVTRLGSTRSSLNTSQNRLASLNSRLDS
ncbi:MAG: hypothetical protein ACFCU3_08865 [Verrucomicrobiales bacterium]